MAREGRSFYRLISTIYVSPDGEIAVTYGFEAVINGQVTEVPDLDFDSAAVAALIDRLRVADVDTGHLWDIAQDFVQWRSMI